MKFLKFLIFLALISLIPIFIFFLNIKTYFSSADFTKNFLEESKAYSAIAIGLRDNLASSSEEANKELIQKFAGDAIDEATVKQFLNNVIDQFFAITKLPKAERKITIPYTMIGNKINALSGTAGFDIMADPQAKQYLTDKSIDLSNSKFVSAFADTGKMLLIYGGIIALLIVLMLLGGTWPQKLRWLSFAFLFPALSSLTVVLFLFLAGNTDFFQSLAKNAGLEDGRFIIAGGKIIGIIWDYQKPFYIITTVILLVVSIVLFVLSLHGKPAEAKQLDITKKPVSPALPPITK